MKKWYETLGVPETATGTGIKRAYRKLAFEHHPDRNHGDDNAVRKFKEITEAYNSLINPSTTSTERLERKVGGLTREEVEILNNLKLDYFKECLGNTKSVSKVFLPSVMISASMLGSYAIYEQFNDSGAYGILWVFAASMLGIFGVAGKIEAVRAQKELERDIETLIEGMKRYHGPR